MEGIHRGWMTDTHPFTCAIVYSFTPRGNFDSSINVCVEICVGMGNSTQTVTRTKTLELYDTNTTRCTITSPYHVALHKLLLFSKILGSVKDTFAEFIQCLN